MTARHDQRAGPAEWAATVSLKDQPPVDLARAAARINAQSARTHSSVDRALGVVVALVLGIVGALLLLHYLTPCAEGTLC